MSARELWLDTVELRRHTGTRRAVGLDATLDELAVGDTEVVGGRLALELVVEAVTEGVVVTGEVRGRWRGPCRRCLEPTEGDLVVEIHEVYEADPSDGETWPLEEEGVDLAPMVRESAVLALPLSPLCREECAGPEPERFPTGPVGADGAGEPEPVRDPRWAVLDELSFDD